MRAYTTVHTVLEAMRLLELSQQEGKTTSKPPELRGEVPNLYFDPSGGRGLGFFPVHQTPYHIF